MAVHPSSIHLYTHHPPIVRLPTYLLSIHPPTRLPIQLSTHPSTHSSSIHPSILHPPIMHLPTHLLSTYPPACPSNHPPTHPSTYLPIIHPPIYPSSTHRALAHPSVIHSFTCVPILSSNHPSIQHDLLPITRVRLRTVSYINASTHWVARK